MNKTHFIERRNENEWNTAVDKVGCDVCTENDENKTLLYMAGKRAAHTITE